MCTSNKFRGEADNVYLESNWENCKLSELYIRRISYKHKAGEKIELCYH